MRYINNEFTKFIIVGGINTLHYYLIYILCLSVFQLHYFLAHTLGFFVSLVGSFFLNSFFTYKIKPTLRKFLRFPLTQVVNTGLSTVLLFLFVDILRIESSIAPIIAVCFTVPATFITTGKVLKPSC
ncbi:GtrA family protein [Virgibacillus alimentarius]|uniref:Flippase GtrA n=1 Tax=Virgibacillus alimentarius TaxID=698769 RepID=A0ABS4S9H4_9BACI|nr:MULTISPECIES: GtrA family protein [Virgibacillus]MBP2257524.1 putative flippase GtrA [Virgibacillus alimentarius]HLR68876.1 GtrA family protein [Virgibacillus sp.]